MRAFISLDLENIGVKKEIEKLINKETV